MTIWDTGHDETVPPERARCYEKGYDWIHKSVRES